MIPADILAILQQQPCGLVFDIDGTLSPIAPTPDEARLYPGVADSLAKATSYAHVAIITGRAIADGAQLVNVDGLTYIGTHGLEWCAGLPSTHPIQLADAAQPYIQPGKYLLDLAERELTPQSGVIVQRKSVGGSIHYRLTADPEQTRERIFALLTGPAQQVHMRLREGKRVVEILAPLTINKGQALRRYVAEQKLRGVLFAGDDLTDLDAMLETERLRQEGLNARSVVVQHPDTRPELLKHADHTVQGVAEMAQLLAEIVAYLANTHAAA